MPCSPLGAVGLDFGGVGYTFQMILSELNGCSAVQVRLGPPWSMPVSHWAVGDHFWATFGGMELV